MVTTAQRPYHKVDIEKFLDNQIWKEITRIALAQIQNRVPGVMAQFGTDLPLDLQASRREFVKGEVAGIELFLKMPNLLIAEIEDNEAIDEQKEKDEDNG